MSVRSAPVHDRDYIAIMPEDEIRAKVSQYRGWIESGRRRNLETYQIEVEYCYLADELRVRENRRRAHEEYMRRNPQLFESNGGSYDYEFENDLN